MSEQDNTLSEDLSEIVTGNYLLVSVTVRTYGGQRKDAAVTSEIHRTHNASDDTGTYVRKLFGKKNARLDEVSGAYNALRNFMYGRTLPWVSDTTGNAKGDRLLPVAESLQFIADFADKKKAAAELRDKMADELDTIIAEARSKMGDMAPDLSDYPDAYEFKRKFDATLEVSPVPAISDFSRLSVPAKLAQGLQGIYQKRMSKQMENAKQDAINRVLVRLDKMSKQYLAEAAGNKTRLFQSLIDNLQQEASLFAAVFAPEGGEYAAIAAEIQSTLLDITDIKVVKGNAAIARKYGQQAATLAARIRGENAPTFEDVEEDATPVAETDDLDARLDAALADMDVSDNDATETDAPAVANTQEPEPEGDAHLQVDIEELAGTPEQEAEPEAEPEDDGGYIGEPDPNGEDDSDYIGQPDKPAGEKKFKTMVVNDDIDFDDFLL